MKTLLSGIWKRKYVNSKAFISIFSILIGIGSGLAAVVIKKSVAFIDSMNHLLIPNVIHNYWYFLLPAIGISLAVIFIKYAIGRPVRHGIPNVLYSISKRNGKITRHNMFSSIVTSALTVGFGGSVGLEGPTVATGAAIGSNASIFFNLEYRKITLMLGCACAGAMAAIFKAPIAAIVFAVEVIMIDLTSFSLIPLLLSSSSAVLTSYFFLGQGVSYPYSVVDGLKLINVPWYIVLGVVSGFASVYFNKIYRMVAERFGKVGSPVKRLLIGASLLGLITFIFPPLFGEGYHEINNCLAGNFAYLFEKSLFSPLQGHIGWLFLLIVAMIIFKIFATSFTFGAGGVGGIFAPTLFMGVHVGALTGLLLEFFNLPSINTSNFALLGMTGMIAGVLHAPLTGIFLIAELTGGYKLFVPLMIVSSTSYLTVKLFVKNSVYTYQLASRKELFTHNKDKAVLSLLKANELIETNFETLHINDTLGDLVKVIEKSSRNLFPIINDKNHLVGMVKLDDVRRLIFRPEKYNDVKIKDLMYYPEFSCSPNDSMHDIVELFNNSGRYNLAVVDNGQYIGFISRAKVFSTYQKMLKHLSHD